MSWLTVCLSECPQQHVTGCPQMRGVSPGLSVDLFLYILSLLDHVVVWAAVGRLWSQVHPRTMATQEATPGSQSEESNALTLPSAYDIRDYVLQRPSLEANSEAFSSEEALSVPCSSDTDPALLFHSSTIGGDSGGRFSYLFWKVLASLFLLTLNIFTPVSAPSWATRTLVH
nr:shieldin complex subunit 1 isoform X6 [Kogia breviceps]